MKKAAARIGVRVIEWERLPQLRSPVLITAFEGWNDAGDAGTDALDHLRQIWGSEVLGELEPDDYYDFQVNRPHIKIENDSRTITWPTSTFYVVRGHSRDFVLLRGIEPNMSWRRFCADILEVADDLEVELVINLGALLADVPHTRAIPVTAFASRPDLIANLGFDRSGYEGPTGIVGVLQYAFDASDVPAVSLWAAVPHYVAQTPCPKATLALINRIADILDEPIPLGGLPEESAAWQQGVAELAEEDSDIAEYVEKLERARDNEEISAASGDAIAAEFQRYLRRHER
jgi:proteasome assembly chaperone (PAC2) family protein